MANKPTCAPAHRHTGPTTPPRRNTQEAPILSSPVCSTTTSVGVNGSAGNVIVHRFKYEGTREPDRCTHLPHPLSIARPGARPRAASEANLNGEITHPAAIDEQGPGNTGRVSDRWQAWRATQLDGRSHSASILRDPATWAPARHQLLRRLHHRRSIHPLSTPPSTTLHRPTPHPPSIDTSPGAEKRAAARAWTSLRHGPRLLRGERTNSGSCGDSGGDGARFLAHERRPVGCRRLNTSRRLSTILLLHTHAPPRQDAPSLPRTPPAGTRPPASRTRRPHTAHPLPIRTSDTRPTRSHIPSHHLHIHAPTSPPPLSPRGGLRSHRPRGPTK